MAKANKKATKKIPEGTMLDKGFDSLILSLDNMVASIEEQMPLFAASLKLSKLIAIEYKKSAIIARGQNAK